MASVTIEAFEVIFVAKTGFSIIQQLYFYTTMNDDIEQKMSILNHQNIIFNYIIFIMIVIVPSKLSVSNRLKTRFFEVVKPIFLNNFQNNAY